MPGRRYDDAHRASHAQASHADRSMKMWPARAPGDEQTAWMNCQSSPHQYPFQTTESHTWTCVPDSSHFTQDIQSAYQQQQYGGEEDSGCGGFDGGYREAFARYYGQAQKIRPKALEGERWWPSCGWHWQRQPTKSWTTVPTTTPAQALYGQGKDDWKYAYTVPHQSQDYLCDAARQLWLTQHVLAFSPKAPAFTPVNGPAVTAAQKASSVSTRSFQKQCRINKKCRYNEPHQSSHQPYKSSKTGTFNPILFNPAFFTSDEVSKSKAAPMTPRKNVTDSPQQGLASQEKSSTQTSSKSPKRPHLQLIPRPMPTFNYVKTANEI